MWVSHVSFQFPLLFYQMSTIIHSHSEFRLIRCKHLASQWIFIRKMKANRSIDKYKARFLIKSYKQWECLYYFDTYSPVIRINSIKMILAIAVLRNLKVHKMDVQTF